MPHDSYQRVDRCQPLGGGLGPQTADVGVPVDHLPLQVRQLDHVGVSHADGSDTGRREVDQCRGPQSSRTDDQHPRVLETTLPLHAHIGDENLPGITLDLLGEQRRRRLDERWKGHAGDITPG